MSDTHKRLEELLKFHLGNVIRIDELVRIIEDKFNITDKVDFDNKVLPLKGQALRWGDLSHDSSSIESKKDERPVTDIEHANIVCSDIKDDWVNRHKLVLDIDHPVHVVESSEGKSHLYIDKPMDWNQIVLLMAAMVEVGLVEQGYMFASIERGYTSVRVPWALKNSGVYIDEPPADVSQI